jgi:NAD(P)H-nitrite reductase large subunit
MMSKYLIIGNSTAGLSAARALTERDPGASMTVISAERNLPYSRVLLTHLIAGKATRRTLDLVGPDFYRQVGITLLQGMRVVCIDPGDKCVTLESGERLSYGALLISTGSSPVFPAGLSPADPHVAGLRTLEDCDKILRHAAPSAVVAVIGGGPVGVKLACALREAGAAVHMIVSSPQLLSQVADDEAAGMVQKRMEERGIRIKIGVDLSRLEPGSRGAATLLLNDGMELGCSLAVFCKGVRPNTEILPGLQPPGGGIRVDRFMRSAYADIYAAGDAAETFEITRRQYCTAATWPHAVQQGRLAGMNMAGCEAPYGGSLFRNAMEIFGLPFISIGICRTSAGGNWDVEISRDRSVYRKLIYRGNRLVGAQLVGRVGEAGALQAEIRRGAAQDLSEQLFAGRRDF